MKTTKPTKVKTKDELFVPLSQDDFLPGSGGAGYISEVICILIEQINRLEKKVKKLTPQTKVKRK